ncbi:hypothetical protein B14911_25030 [Bacillus sp. NRRL B-14911]|nr:hypothetical protein B14911_25030 [Bacillus sp. NRRL B-14911]
MALGYHVSLIMGVAFETQAAYLMEKRVDV